MNAIVFDTHLFVTELKAAGFDDRQAEAVVNTIKKSHKEADLSTKADLRELEYRLTIRFGTMLAVAVGTLAVIIKVL